MLKVIVNGCFGKMGKVLTRCIQEDEELELVCGVSQPPIEDASFNVYSKMSEVVESCDVIIDFSHHTALDDVLGYALKTKTPLVIATTGFNNEELAKIQEASKSIPVFHSSNMSLGVNVLLKLVKKATKMLQGFDIEVIEKHHNKKVDAPSGTAIMIANAIKEVMPTLENNYGRYGREAKRTENEIGIHAIRGGTIVGEHDAIFAGHDEIVELRHTAQSKDIFAKGAIVAAKYLANKDAGYYNMDDILN
ncbi:4-hydroxy-tetrahydrodipicolinate reductase [Romboutsia weinsteinii]|uniref:4-hydroxy-tetrahydrodipicolinate reductase n=1 Tax=Romboutsia weinsteinii TaxID=2020949 RepID=A0A371J192_9FIRM|nr:4-hydroxy-tetrahydrodipicolinate reductase [Romboutsia weinsteinii]RDY26426.1 4-hydroxy-tetrahydrodipicolinate reductase [Romboutsia weinsteinii]